MAWNYVIYVEEKVRSNMPAMPRMSGKAKKIAYAILGKPQNMFDDKKKSDQVEKRLQFEETVRVR